jgi:hypothetical protein
MWIGFTRLEQAQGTCVYPIKFFLSARAHLGTRIDPEKRRIIQHEHQ